MGKLSIGLMSSQISEKYRKQITCCSESWGVEAEKLSVPVFYFAGCHREDQPLGSGKIINLAGVGDDFASATYKQWLGLRWMKNKNPSDFYLLAGTDNFVEVERLLSLLAKYAPEHPFVISGYQEVRGVEGEVVSFPLGGSGIILTRAALELLEPEIDRILEEWPKKVVPALRDACDLSLAYYAEKKAIPLVREPYLYPCNWLQGFKDVKYPLRLRGFDPDKLVICHYMEEEDVKLYQRFRGRANAYREVYSHCRLAIENSEILGPLIPIVSEYARDCRRIFNVSGGVWTWSWVLLKVLVDNQDTGTAGRLRVIRSCKAEPSDQSAVLTDTAQKLGVDFEMKESFDKEEIGEVDLLFMPVLSRELLLLMSDRIKKWVIVYDQPSKVDEIVGPQFILEHRSANGWLSVLKVVKADTVITFKM